MTIPEADHTLFDTIADLLPANHREHFYRRMAHFRSLAPNDDILQIAEAMGFLALIIRETPPLIVEERKRFETLLNASVHAIRDALDAATTYHRLLDSRLQQLPDKIQAGIDPESTTAWISENLRQQFTQTGLPAAVQEIAAHAASLKAASRQLSSALSQFSAPNTGACHRLQTAISSMHSDLGSTAEYIRSLTRTLRQELFTAVALLCFGAAVIGFCLGIAYVHFR